MDDKYIKECKLFNVDCFRAGAPYFVKDRHGYTYYGLLTDARPTHLTFYCTRAYQTSELKDSKQAKLMELSINYTEMDEYELELLESKQDCYAVSFTEEQEESSNE